MKIISKKSRGISIVALVLAIVLLTTFSLLALFFLGGHSSMAETFWQAQQAFYIADAGLVVNARNLQANWAGWNNPANFPDMNFAGGNIHVVITDDNDDGNPGVDSNGRLIMRVTGTLGNTSRTVQAIVTRTVPAVDCAVYTSGDLDVGGSAQVVGQAIENSLSMPVLNITEAIALAKANHGNGFTTRTDGNYFQGAFSSGPDSLNGVIYVDTYANGNPASVNLNNLSTNDGQPAFLIVMGNLSITGNVNFNGLIYNGGGMEVDASLAGNCVITGGIIASHDVRMRGTADVIYNESMTHTATTQSLLTENPANYIYDWQEID